MKTPSFELGTALFSVITIGIVYAVLNVFDSEAQSVEVESAIPPSELSDCAENLKDLPRAFDADSRTHAGTLVVVYKRETKIGLYQDGLLVTDNGVRGCFPVALGVWPYEPKVETDFASTPEGWYHVASKHTSDPSDAYPATSYYKAFLVDYPNLDDVERALDREVIDRKTAAALRSQIASGEMPNQDTPMGGSILIHGWDVTNAGSTAGCVGVDDKNIDWLFERISAKTPVLFLPWRQVRLNDGTFATDVAPLPARVADFTDEGLKTIVDQDASAASGRMVFEPIVITAKHN